MKIAVPNNPNFENLYGNTHFINNTKDLQLYKVREEDTHKLLLEKKVDAALLSPIGYGYGYKDSDFRIIPETACSAVEYTGLASIFFQHGLKNITKVASDSPNDFMIKMGGLLLAEKFDLAIELLTAKGDKAEILKKYDAAVLWQQSDSTDNALDISDEWFDAFEMPLPLLAWVTHEGQTPDKLVQYIRNMAIPDLEKEEKKIETIDKQVDFDLRKGHIFWTWTDEVEKAFEQILQYLFFHQFFQHIPAVKVLGRD